MRVLLAAFVVASAALPLAAQKFGPAENLGPAIPTPQFLVDRMLEAGHVKPGEVVYDLGSGDGRVVICAAQKFGARAVGVELMPDLVRKARERIQSLGLADRVSIVEDSALRVDLSPGGLVDNLFPHHPHPPPAPPPESQLKIGARVVSNEFPVRGWKATEMIQVKVGRVEHSIFVYEIGKTQ